MESDSITRASKLVRDQLEALQGLADSFLDAPSSDAYVSLANGISRLEVAVKVQSLVGALNLEAAAQSVVEEWHGGGGSSGGGGASGGW